MRGSASFKWTKKMKVVRKSEEIEDHHFTGNKTLIRRKLKKGMMT